MIKTLVFSGGGIRAISYVGALKCLKEMEILDNIDTIISVSAGSIFGLALVLGYEYHEMYSMIMETDFKSLVNINIKNFFTKYGIDSGIKIINWVKDLLKRKGYDENITFLQLYAKTGKKLGIISTNLTCMCAEQFDYIKCPHMPVVKAIKMSTAIPIVFYNETYKDCVYVDGGICGNYPERFVIDKTSTLGMELCYNWECLSPKFNNNIKNYVYNILLCYLKNKKSSINEEINKVYIYTNNVTSIDFDIDSEKKIELMKSGYNAVLKYKNNFLSNNK